MMALLFLISAQEFQGAGNMTSVLHVRKWTQRLREWECQAVSHKVQPAIGFGSHDS